MGIETKLTFNVREAVDKIDTTIKERMLEAVNEVRNVTLETLSGPRSGRTYKVPGTQRTYTASAPGQPPAQATGHLRQSMKVAVEGEAKQVIGTVGTDLEYGKCLEFGTKKMAARPWLRPSFEKALPKVKEILSRKWL